MGADIASRFGVMIGRMLPFLAGCACTYNQRLYVHDGDWVKRGQIIAEMGYDSTGTAALHFEIRLHGNPVNPLNLLS